MPDVARRPGTTADGRDSVIGVKGSAEYRQWLQGLADHQRLPVVPLIDRALVEYAAAHGYQTPAPRRTKSRGGVPRARKLAPSKP